MAYMFYEAEAFNQPLSFNTSEVTDVRLHLFVVWSPTTQ